VPALPPAPQRASAPARFPPVWLRAVLAAEKLCRQVAPVPASQVAEACAPASVAPTRLAPAHVAFVPAVQSLLDVARLVPPGAAACAAPSVWVRQPAPTQLPVTSAMPLAATPPVIDSQPPAAAHVAVDVAWTAPPGAAVVSVVEEVRVAQPVVVPSSQTAAT
jgi:hypothetical protein